jgi:hypothetical protein
VAWSNDAIDSISIVAIAAQIHVCSHPSLPQYIYTSRELLPVVCTSDSVVVLLYATSLHRLIESASPNAIPSAVCTFFSLRCSVARTIVYSSSVLPSYSEWVPCHLLISTTGTRSLQTYECWSIIRSVTLGNPVTCQQGGVAHLEEACDSHGVFDFRYSHRRKTNRPEVAPNDTGLIPISRFPMASLVCSGRWIPTWLSTWTFLRTRLMFSYSSCCLNSLVVALSVVHVIADSVC